MPPLRFARVETSLGPMWVAETDAGVAAVERETRPSRHSSGRSDVDFPTLEPVPADLDVAWLTDALGGGPLPPVDLRGLSDFDARVYEAVRSVPRRRDGHLRRGGRARRITGCRASGGRRHVSLPALPGRAMPPRGAGVRWLVGLGRRRSAQAAPAGGGRRAGGLTSKLLAELPDSHEACAIPTGCGDSVAIGQ